MRDHRPARDCDVDPNARYFTPWKVMPHAELMRIEEPSLEMQPQLAEPPRIDEREALMATLFLRRYVTYCARGKRYAQMQGAARLLRGVARTSSKLRTNARTA